MTEAVVEERERAWALGRGLSGDIFAWTSVTAAPRASQHLGAVASAVAPLTAQKGGGAGPQLGGSALPLHTCSHQACCPRAASFFLTQAAFSLRPDRP